MSIHRMSFGTVEVLEPDLAEIIIDDGVEMTLEMVNEYHQVLLSHMQAPFHMLINKKNAYTYTFEAQRVVGKLKEFGSIAVVTYSPVQRVSTDSLINVNRNQNWDIQMFEDKPSAMDWLLARRANQ